MVYAVIASGGKQYRVVPGQTLKLELLEKEAGKTFDFEQVLLVANGDAIKIGSPFLKDAKVTAEVVGAGRADKVHIMKFRRRKHHMKQAGHRQHFIEVKITSIDGVAAEAKAKTATAKTAKAKKTVKAKTSTKKTVATAKMSEA